MEGWIDVGKQHLQARNHLRVHLLAGSRVRCNLDTISEASRGRNPDGICGDALGHHIDAIHQDPIGPNRCGIRTNRGVPKSVTSAPPSSTSMPDSSSSESGTYMSPLVPMRMRPHRLMRCPRTQIQSPQLRLPSFYTRSSSFPPPWPRSFEPPPRRRIQLRRRGHLPPPVMKVRWMSVGLGKGKGKG